MKACEYSGGVASLGYTGVHLSPHAPGRGEVLAQAERDATSGPACVTYMAAVSAISGEDPEARRQAWRQHGQRAHRERDQWWAAHGAKVQRAAEAADWAATAPCCQAAILAMWADARCSAGQVSTCSD